MSVKIDVKYIRLLPAVTAYLLVLLCLTACSGKTGGTETGTSGRTDTVDTEDSAGAEPGVETGTKPGTEKENVMGQLSWPESSVLPAFAAPAGHLDAFYSFGKSAPAVTMMVSLQGLLNRKQPRLLVLADNYRAEQWPEEMGLAYTLETDEFKLIKKYLDEIKGLVVFDAAVPDTMNLATTVAGLEGGLVVTPVLAKTLTEAPYNLPILEDYRGKFADKYEVYDYALLHVFPKCNKRLIIGLNPALGSGHHGYLRDLAAASASMVLWLNPIDTAGSEKDYEKKAEYEKDLEYLKKFLDQCTAVDTYYIGWWPEEGIGIREASKYGIPTIPADFFENMTVYAGMPKEFNIPEVPAKPELKEDKFYLAFMFSDGDNAQYCEHFLKTNTNSWSSPSRGQVPITWTMAPALIDMAPKMLDYYYRTATDQDYIVSGPSGFGYTDPAKWPEENLVRYAQLTEEYFKKSAFNFITVWNHLPSKKGSIFAEHMPSLVGLSVQERFTDQLRTEIFDDKLSLITAIPRYDGDYERTLGIIMDEIRSSDRTKPKFWISQLVAWDLGVSHVISMQEAIKEEFGDYVEFVRADHLMMLYNEYNGVPYNVSLRADAAASSTDEGFDAKGLVDGSFSGQNGWQSSETEDCTVTIDLKKEYELSRYVLKNAGTAYFETSCNTKSFEISVSTDGESFIVADSVEGNKEDIVDRQIMPVTARYIRIHILDPGEDQTARLQEVMVYGVPAGVME